MKLRSIITTILITIFAFGAVLYTSCTKNKCTNTTCQNGGSCSNGFCTCPYGYSGDFCEIRATSYINYMNNSYTDITLTLNTGPHGSGYAFTVPAGRSKGFTGFYGDTLMGNAFTRGPYGEQINWDTVMNIFPINGTLNVNLNVDSTYFYLTVINDSSSAHLFEIDVNLGLGSHFERDIILPYPYLAYQSSIGLGYFYSSHSSNVYIKTTFHGGGVWSFPMLPSTSLLGSPMTNNQAVTVTAN